MIGNAKNVSSPTILNVCRGRRANRRATQREKKAIQQESVQPDSNSHQTQSHRTERKGRVSVLIEFISLFRFELMVWFVGAYHLWGIFVGM
jgi:hypothetical protein